MATVLFKPVNVDTLKHICCGASGRKEFNLRECHYRARKACLQGTAEYCLILQDGQLIARWERLPNGEVQQIEGEKEILK